MTRAAVAFVDEARCIGCTLCIAACPVDAIVGAKGWMHTVVAGWCTGCELCLPPCPVDCIALVPPPGPWTTDDARAAKQRQKQRSARLAREAPAASLPARDQRRAAVADALRRTRNRTT